MADAITMTPLAGIAEIRGLGMVLIRADLGRAGDAIAEAAGLALPETGRFTTDGLRWLGWMSPDELLLIVPGSERGRAVADVAGALTGEHALVQDVSDMRCVFDVTGRKPGQVLAKLCPADLETRPRDGLRRTRAAQVACAVWRIDGAETGRGWRLIAFRSVRDYVAQVLAGAAAPGSDLDPR
ncbi:sarcosine oxidase subunit gamma [Paracoccus sp. Z118]|uniref:sarcosine oxidase subunit gamma n=1 Tax=Paracoccus sp. Z118 TaxID=2851017 RepID=UPI001C2BA86E|nr:sarcosine oxidase subunit gamma family protein [Paracoccus sp. Z118]MBV0891732.1 sarcosine oxidase subunit gamma [Paracoccus sp. Z118]